MRTKWLSIVVLFTLLAGAVPLTVQAAPSRENDGPPTGEDKYQLQAVEGTPVNLNEAAIYIVQLEDPPAPSYAGGINGLEATNPRARGEVKFEPRSDASIAYVRYLKNQQTQFIGAVEESIARRVDVKYQYQYALNGMAIYVTPAEAEKIAAMPGVANIERDVILQPTTDAGPEWIGAPGIWDGTDTGGLPGTKGEGVIVGILDTGINMDHPSFADIGDDGYDHTNPWGTGVYTGTCVISPTIYTCNDKLIGAWDFVDGLNESDGPEDNDGHGSHTASTTAGNVVYSPTIQAATITITANHISGVAPHANIISYDVCDIDGCPNSATTAAKEQAILDEVDVINYSIGGGGANPWSDSGSQGWLAVRDAGIFVATSAGNDGPGAATVGSPANSPWMLSVGASTHDRKFRNALISMSGGDSAAPADIEGKSITSGYGPAPIVYAGWYTSTGSTNDALCLDPFPPGTFSGEIVVCDRGEIARTEKGDNVLAGGAGGYVLANDQANGPSINADTHSLPAVHITYQDGETLKTWLASGSGHMATIAGTTLMKDNAYADIMAGFSSRGPNNTAAAASIVKPDVTAPGVDVFAAYHDGPEYGSISGTSMASPHAAGAAALLRALHPDWTPAEIQSALMMTAWTDMLKEDGATEADPFDRGAGRVDLSKAGLAGLVLDETTTNFENADPDMGGDPKTLNLASFGNALCLQECSWNRTLESTLEAPTTYTVTVDAPAGMTVTVEPSTFTVEGLDKQVITVTADVSALPTGDWNFAEVKLETTAYHPTFTTSLEEGFEGVYPPPEWYTYTTGATDDPGWITTTISHSGDYAAAHFDDDTTGASLSWLVTEQFTPTTQTQIAFWQLTYYDDWYGYHGVMVSTGSGDPNDGDFVELAELDDGTSGYWEKVTRSLSAYAGQPIYVAFLYIGDFNDWWVVDDVAIREVSDSVYAAPNLHMPLAVIPTTGVLPDLVEINTRRNAGSQLIEDLQALEITDLTIENFGFNEATLTDQSLSEDSANDSPYDNLTDGVFYITVTVGADAQRLVAELTASEAPDLDLFVGRDLDGDGPEESEEICRSTTSSWAEYCNISGSALMTGEWWILVQNWKGSIAQPDNLTLATAVVSTDQGNMMVTGPVTVTELTEFDLRLFWDIPTMQAGDRWYGAFSIGTDATNPGNIGSIPINITRYADDVAKSVSPMRAAPGDIVTYTITVQPDISEQDLTYFITDTLPISLTYVPGSAVANAGTVAVTGNTLTWSGKALPDREYFVTTSLNDPLCAMPLANSGSYVDLASFGFGTTSGIEGNNVAFQDGSYGGGNFHFYGDPQSKTLYFSDDGIVSLNAGDIVSGTTYANTSIPTASVPNALLAMLWNNMEIVYQAGTGENNRGVTTGIQLTTGGIPSRKLLEFDDIQKLGDPNSQIDFEVAITEGVNDAFGAYEIIYAYDNITGDFTNLSIGTIGVENYAGTAGTEYAHNDTNLQTLQDGMAICFDYLIPDKPVEITYQAMISDSVNLGETIVNRVEHTTDDPGAAVELAQAPITIFTLGNSTKVSSSAGQQVMSGDFVTYTITLSNTGDVDVTVMLTDTLGTYYMVADALDFTETTTGTLTWTGPVTANTQISLHFVAQVVPIGDLDIGMTMLDNTFTIDDHINLPVQISDQDPPYIDIGALYLPIVLRSS